MTYKEFYFWLDGYLSAKSKEENNGNVHFMDIFPILEKMKEVKDETLDISKFKHLTSRQNNIVIPEYRPNDDDDLGKPPKIVM